MIDSIISYEPLIIFDLKRKDVSRFHNSFLLKLKISCKTNVFICNNYLVVKFLIKCKNVSYFFSPFKIYIPSDMQIEIIPHCFRQNCFVLLSCE